MTFSRRHRPGQRALLATFGKPRNNAAAGSPDDSRRTASSAGIADTLG
jgi:hypothetical protein